MINLNQLRAFYSVVKTGTFSKAAGVLFVTEPAVFIQVRSLERCIGFKLLDKLGKDLALTETGEILFDYAYKIFSLVDEAEKAIKDVQDLKNGDLRVGSTGALSQHLMPIIISAFHDLCPTIQMRLGEASSSNLVKGVLAHDFELAVVARVAYPNQIESIPLSKEEVLLVASPRSKVALKPGCSLKDLNGSPMICKTVGSATGQMVWKEFKKMNIRPSAVIESENTEFIKNLVKNDKGVSFLAKFCVTEEVKRGELVVITLKEGPFFIDIDVIYLRGRTLSPAASKLLGFLRQTCMLKTWGLFTNERKARKQCSFSN
jgi:LysR family transcriptional regulator, low CO2-responsive transcriptional regulator